MPGEEPIMYVTIRCADLPPSLSIVPHEPGASLTTPGASQTAEALSMAIRVPAVTDMGRRVTLSILPPPRDALNVLMQTEAQHRARNLVSLSIALAHQSLGPLTADPAVAAFIDRLRSLDAVARIGCDVAGEFCTLPGVFGQVLARFDDPTCPRITQSGPSVAIAARWAHLLAMVTHELAANAIRHGALGLGGGRVDLRWTVVRHPDDPEPDLHLSWRELGGPPVSPQARSGFGTRLLRDMIGAQARCEPAMRFLPGGLVYTLTIKLATSDVRD